jgi:transposase
MRKAAKILGVSRQHVGKWCEAFEAGGYDALELGRRGRKPAYS